MCKILSLLHNEKTEAFRIIRMGETDNQMLLLFNTSSQSSPDCSKPLLPLLPRFYGGPPCSLAFLSYNVFLTDLSGLRIWAFYSLDIYSGTLLYSPMIKIHSTRWVPKLLYIQYHNHGTKRKSTKIPSMNLQPGSWSRERLLCISWALVSLSSLRFLTIN